MVRTLELRPVDRNFIHAPDLEKQTVAFNIQARVDFKSKKRARMSVWEAMELLNTLIDESDPDVRFFLAAIIPLSEAHDVSSTDEHVPNRTSAPDG
jgi:hypothetical protein